MFRQSVKKVSPGQIAKATRLQGKRCNASTRSDNETTSKQYSLFQLSSVRNSFIHYRSFSTSAAKPQPVEGQYNFDIMAKALEKAPTPEAYVRKVEPAATQPAVPMDGNQAAAYVAYAWSETSFIYPISPVCSQINPRSLTPFFLLFLGHRHG